jgi:hypothetical protein
MLDLVRVGERIYMLECINGRDRPHEDMQTFCALVQIVSFFAREEYRVVGLLADGTDWRIVIREIDHFCPQIVY